MNSRITAPPPYIRLASRSPRRRELLTQIGLPWRLVDVEIDESPVPGEAPDAMALRLAGAKAAAAFAAACGATGPDRTDRAVPLLAADTLVVADRQILGKPADPDDARRMLRLLSGRVHQVYTAVAVTSPTLSRSLVQCSQVRLREITTAEIDAYLAGGEPLDKAGAYAIQGVGAVFVAGLQGSYSGVMGLPLFETATLLAEFGYRFPVPATASTHA